MSVEWFIACGFSVKPLALVWFGYGPVASYLVAASGGVCMRRDITHSRYEMKLIEPMITPPPKSTKKSAASPNIAAPRMVAHTSYRKVTGCVTVSGAACNALVMVKCPNVANTATSASQAVSARLGTCHTA